MKTTISNSNLTAIINHAGAELISLVAVKTKKEYLWEGHPEYWGKHAPILFPIVGTLKNNQYEYNGMHYTLSRHGFARDRIFNLVRHSENEAVFSLQSDDSTQVVYPFCFELQVKYTLTNSELTITYKVINDGVETIYYSIGGHPALALPKDFEAYSLLFEKDTSLLSYQLENDLLSDTTTAMPLQEHKLPLSYSIFEKDALIFKTLKSKQIQLLENNVPVVLFKFPDFPNFGIWTKNKAPFICLEPWLGYSDVLTASGKIEDKEGIQKLEKNTSKEYSFSIEIV